MKENKSRPQPIEDRWLTTKEASEYLGISTNALRIMKYRFQIPCSKLGSRLRFKLSDLNKSLEEVKG